MFHLNYREWIHRDYVGSFFTRTRCVDRPDLGGVLITLDLEPDDDPELTSLLADEGDTDDKSRFFPQ